MSDGISRGIRAKEVLESEAFKGAVEKVQQSIFDGFAATDPKDIAGLQEHRLRLKCLADVTRQLAAVMSTGRLAEEERLREETLKERVEQRLKRGIRSVRSVF